MKRIIVTVEVEVNVTDDTIDVESFYLDASIDALSIGGNLRGDDESSVTIVGWETVNVSEKEES